MGYGWSLENMQKGWCTKWDKVRLEINALVQDEWGSGMCTWLMTCFQTGRLLILILRSEIWGSVRCQNFWQWWPQWLGDFDLIWFDLTWFYLIWFYLNASDLTFYSQQGYKVYAKSTLPVTLAPNTHISTYHPTFHVHTNTATANIFNVLILYKENQAKQT
jgi:hypothetical protein